MSKVVEYVFSLEWSDPTTLTLPSRECIQSATIQDAIDTFTATHHLQLLETSTDKDEKGRHIMLLLVELSDNSNAEYIVYAD